MNEKIELDKRKAFILATVVYEYIATAEPVGSNTLTQKYNLGVSSATIRNEMAELEAGGYLIQPHTSAGRIPSDAGYRTYVDRLMRPEALAPDDVRRIRDQFREASREMDERHRSDDAAALESLEQPSVRHRALARLVCLQAHSVDLALGPHGARDRRYVAGRRLAIADRLARRGHA